MCFFNRAHKMAVLLVLLASLAQAQACLAADDEVQTVTIGFTGALSGVSEAFSKSLANAAELAIAENNRAPFKINGKRIQFRLLRMDDRSDPERAKEVARILVKEGVIGVIGGANSGTSIAGAKIYAAAGIPQISPAASLRKYTESGSRTTFRMVGIDDQACVFLGEYVVNEMHAQRVAVIDNGTLFGSTVAARFSEVAQDHGAVIVRRDSVSDMLTDFSGILKSAKAQDVDLVFFGGYSSQTSMLAQNMARMEMKAHLVTTMVGIVGTPFLISAGSAANGTIAQEAGISFGKMPGWKKFETDFTQRFDFNIYGLTPYAYDAAHVLMAAVRQANALDPRKVAYALHQISHKGLTGTVSFDASGNPRTPSFTIYEVQNQKWVALRTHTVR
ncbi:branched-chain amino acid ABC transporter substrate-binding protein [Herbaspirillum sp. RV1423]|uniref:branched-chain amino acid ABC transporter substrate-binding protein n=1 Tax=Herbaspirillum sp. RV1423 TaxID=1443993 RepID=UPI0004AF440D|nr:branched-chain amino acid ABC transporter substrate-binding protein [Herbaspirillum sp. RV1423]